MDAVPSLIGMHDNLDSFEPDQHRLVARLWHEHSGLRIPRAGAVTEVLVATEYITITMTGESKCPKRPRW